MQFARKNIDRAERQHAESRAVKTIGRVADSVQSSLTVPSPPAATTKSNPSLMASAARRRASPGAAVALNAVRTDGVELTAKAFGFFAARRRIENDANGHARMILAQIALVEQKALRSPHFSETYRDERRNKLESSQMAVFDRRSAAARVRLFYRLENRRIRLANGKSSPVLRPPRLAR